ncbi:hypothetical protein Moror_15488 [Moniliophthora roreri MCA 2997]|uniref:Uncharacterized protein n=2 Tax=Moniliophthora roreri TaxID=221103 RepID=V2WP07_MONRO|nr:hypothetical protein Moror_15488 [Moniliophthora roreri MCA 2997]
MPSPVPPQKHSLKKHKAPITSAEENEVEEVVLPSVNNTSSSEFEPPSKLPRFKCTYTTQHGGQSGKAAGDELVMVLKTPFFFSDIIAPAEKLHRLANFDNAVKVLLDEAAMFKNPDHGHPTLLDQAVVSIATVANTLYTDKCLPAED